MKEEADVIALIKTFSGDDWVIPSVRSIYNHVKKIVFVHSEMSWRGELGNAVKPVVKEKIKPFDVANKIIEINCNTRSQDEQMQTGMKYIRDTFPEVERVMMIDTDEIWTDEGWENAKKQLRDQPKWISGLCCRMQSYIKSPFYAISHLDPLTPMTFVPNSGFLSGDRGMKTRPCAVMEDVVMHHFGFVRRNFNLVLQKLINSHTVEGQKHLPLDYWIGRVWNNLPDKYPKQEGLHPAIGFQNNWMGVKVISLNELPPVLRDAEYEIIKMYLDTERKDV